MPSFEILAKNKATAQFVGIEQVPCRLRTTDCPDRCNHPQQAARFRILNYEEYEQVNKNCDPKKDVLIVSISEDPASPKSTRQSPAIVGSIKSLKAGQKVRITWEHIYVNEDGSNFAQRPVRAIESI
jgi:hypothetical protein